MIAAEHFSKHLIQKFFFLSITFSYWSWQSVLPPFIRPCQATLIYSTSSKDITSQHALKSNQKSFKEGVDNLFAKVLISWLSFTSRYSFTLIEKIFLTLSSQYQVKFSLEDFSFLSCANVDNFWDLSKYDLEKNRVMDWRGNHKSTSLWWKYMRAW